jgi:hypothetical protein
VQIAPVTAATHSLLPPPYGLSTPTFRFRALAALAGRAALGGPREVALGVYLAARLVQDALSEQSVFNTTRSPRAAGARAWLATLALPAHVRAALVRLIDASLEDGIGMRAALAGVIGSTSTYLDVAARLELERLAQTIAI